MTRINKIAMAGTAALALRSLGAIAGPALRR